MKKRPVTLASGQFGDMSLEELCQMCRRIGYEGIELAAHAHFDVGKALEEPGYVPWVKETLEKYGLKCYAISAHLTGQCVGMCGIPAWIILRHRKFQDSRKKSERGL